MNLRIVAFLLLALAFPAGLDARELVMVESRGCLWCALWDRDVGPIYPKTAEAKVAPLRRLDIREVRSSGLLTKSPVEATPTFLLIDDGQEIGRITGYSGDDMFWGLLDAILARPLANATHNRNEEAGVQP